MAKYVIKRNKPKEPMKQPGTYLREEGVLMLHDGFKNETISPLVMTCLLYTSPSPRDRTRSRMPSSA